MDKHRQTSWWVSSRDAETSLDDLHRQTWPFEMPLTIQIGSRIPTRHTRHDVDRPNQFQSLQNTKTVFRKLFPIPQPSGDNAGFQFGIEWDRTICLPNNDVLVPKQLAKLDVRIVFCRFRESLFDSFAYIKAHLPPLKCNQFGSISHCMQIKVLESVLIHPNSPFFLKIVPTCSRQQPSLVNLR